MITVPWFTLVDEDIGVADNTTLGVNLNIKHEKKNNDTNLICYNCGGPTDHLFHVSISRICKECKC